MHVTISEHATTASLGESVHYEGSTNTESILGGECLAHKRVLLEHVTPLILRMFTMGKDMNEFFLLVERAST